MAEYTRADALRYRDHLIAKGLVGSSVGRVISSIRAVFNFAISEYALDLKNPFVGMYFDKSAGVSKCLIECTLFRLLMLEPICLKAARDIETVTSF